ELRGLLDLGRRLIGQRRRGVGFDIDSRRDRRRDDDRLLARGTIGTFASDFVLHRQRLFAVRAFETDGHACRILRLGRDGQLPKVYYKVRPKRQTTKKSTLPFDQRLRGPRLSLVPGPQRPLDALVLALPEFRRRAAGRTQHDDLPRLGLVRRAEATGTL